MERGQGSVHSGHARAWVASAAIAVCVLLDLVVTSTQLIEHYAMPDWHLRDDPAAVAFGVVYTLSALGYTAALLIAVVGYLLWIHRAAQNTQALGFFTDSTSPRAAIIWWFVPFLNLVRPYRSVKGIYELCQVDAPAAGDVVAARPWIFPLWWGCWVVTGFVGNTSLRSSAEVAIWLNAVTTPLMLVAGAGAIAIVWSIEARQRSLSGIASGAGYGIQRA